jgi:CO/xanthine dehydrogenase Mo-binding subunit
LGVPYESVRSTVADTASIGYNHVTGGSRVTYATGIAVVEACNKVIEDLRLRASLMWDTDIKNVVWSEGYAKPVDPSVGNFEPLSLKAIASKRAVTGGPIGYEASTNAGGQAPGFSTQFVDVEVDPETGHVKILQFVAAQDVGRAIHRDYCAGQIVGGVVQGIGWALNEEYIYDSKGRLSNAGFLDYRIPVASDLPMIEAVLVEVPNPSHPFGVKGVGEANIVPPMAAIANAIENAVGRRMTELPMSPPRVLAAIDAG